VVSQSEYQGGPVVVSPVDDLEHAMVGFACLVQEAADLLEHGRHLVPLA